MKQLKSNKGFTLVELVVVIAILGILAGIAIPRFMDATATARGARIEADMRSIDSAEAMFYAANGRFTTNLTSTGTDPLVPSYLAAAPVAPTGDIRFHGQTTNNANTSGIYSVSDITGDNAGRATWNGSTIEQLLATPVASNPKP